MNKFLKTMKYFICALPIVMLVYSCIDNASRYPPDITLNIDFPELSETLFAKVQDNNHPVRIGIYLPENYSNDKKFPLVLWLNGGDGGPGNNVRIPKAVTSNKDIICVNFPLFKTTLDSVNADSSNYWSRMAITNKDAEIIWSQYQILLEKLFETIPNIDTDNTFLGGFSNGAHSTFVLLNRENAEIKNYFKNFFLIEGGNGQFNDPTVLKTHNFLVMVSGENKRLRIRKIYEDAKNAGASAKYYTMANTGHAFPEEFYPVLKEWIERCIVH